MEIKVENKLAWYIVICFVVSYFLNDFFEKSNTNNEWLFYVPGLTAIGIVFFRNKKSAINFKELGLLLKGFKFWIFAPLFIGLLCFLSYGISILFKPSLLKSSAELIHILNTNGFYFGNIGFGILAISLINILLGGLVSILPFLGQELGWRVFVQAQLLKSFNYKQAQIIGGFIWGVWFFIFVNAPYESLPSALLTMLLSLLFCISAGIVLQYFYKKSQSIFVAALAHAALYKTMETASLFISTQEMNKLLYGPMGLVGVFLFSVVAFILLINSNRQI